MIHQVITRVSIDSFREKSAGKKVVLLYPWTNYRNLFLSHFLQNTEEGLLYYRIPQDYTTLSAWLSALVEEMNDVLGKFGKKLAKALEKAESADALGKAFAADLNALKGKNIALFIDELDRVPLDPEFDTFVNATVPALNDNVQLVFSSRLLHHLPWSDMIKNGDAVVLGTEYRRNDVMFTVEDDPKPQVEVYAFGRGHAIINGKEVTNWDGALPRQLFFYFMDCPLVTRDDIFDTFWPDLTVKEATNVFHVTKRKISERITNSVKIEGNYELTTYTSGFYMPSDKVVRHYDAGDFQDAVDTAMTTHDLNEAERKYREAIDLYKAPFLETIDMPWVVDRREHLRRLYAKALMGLGRIYKAQGNNAEALGLLIRASKEDPKREDVHRDIIQVYNALGRTDDAIEHYKGMVKTLRSQYRLKPSPMTVKLYEQLSAS